MQTKFSEDVVGLSDLKVNPGKVVNHAKDSHRPVLVTSRGRGVAVVQGLDEYEKNSEELAFVKAIAKGLLDIEEGNIVDLGEAKKRLGLQPLKVSLSKTALEDLEGIRTYYADLDVPEVGLRFVEELFKHVESLELHPDLGRIVPEFGQDHIREIIHPPFRIVYFRGKQAVQVIRVWRSERLLRL